MSATDTYSTDGPICPHCNHQHRADEPFFYDESLEEMDCDHCQKPFAVSVYTSTSWTCELLPQTDTEKLRELEAEMLAR